MNPKDYCALYKAEFKKYIDQSEHGAIGELERLAIERWKKLYLKKYYFNEQEFEKRIKFCSLINVKSVIDKGKVTQLKLCNWQLLTLAQYSLYLNEHSDEKVIQTISLSFAGKNGKSSLAVIIALMACLIDNRINANIPIICVSQKQANQALDYFKQIIKASPAIQPFFKVLHSTIIYSDKNTTNKIFILTNDSDKVQALEIAIGIVDEIYLFDKDESEVLEVITSKQSTTFNPVKFVIGTFSDKEKHNYENYYVPCEKILRSVEGLEGLEDDSHFILFCSQDSADEFDKPETYIKSNPSLGVVKSLDSLVKQYERTKIFPASLETFKTENLNMWREVVAENRFLTDELVANAMKNFEPIATGSTVILGVDFSKNSDCYSICVMATESDQSSPAGCNFKFQTIECIPNIQENYVKGDINTKRWHVKNYQKYKENIFMPDDVHNPLGYLIPSELPIMDIELIYNIVATLNKFYTISAIAYDPVNSAMVIHRLINEGFNCVPIGQGAMIQNEPLKLLERLISLDHYNSGQTNIIQIAPSPFLAWEFRGAKIAVDIYDNYKLMKRTRKGVPLTIDGVAALTNCIAFWWSVSKDNLSGRGFQLEQFRQLNETTKAA